MGSSEGAAFPEVPHQSLFAVGDAHCAWIEHAVGGDQQRLAAGSEVRSDAGGASPETMKVEQGRVGVAHGAAEQTIAVERCEAVGGEPAGIQPGSLLGGEKLGNRDGNAAVRGISRMGKMEADQDYEGELSGKVDGERYLGR